MMAWAQELRGTSRKSSGFGYSGALTLPRELSVVAAVRGGKERNGKKKSNGDDGGGGGEGKVEFRLRQRPPASLSKLRKELVSAAPAAVTAFVGGPAVEIPGASGPFVDLELELLRPSSASPSAPSASPLPPAAAAVVLLRPWLHAGTETGLEPCAAAVVADWETEELSVVWPRGLLVSSPSSGSSGFSLPATKTAAAEAAEEHGESSLPPLSPTTAVAAREHEKISSLSPSSSLPSLQIDWEAGVARSTGGPCAGLRRGGRNGSLGLRVVSFFFFLVFLKVFLEFFEFFSLPQREKELKKRQKTITRGDEGNLKRKMIRRPPRRSLWPPR